MYVVYLKTFDDRAQNTGCHIFVQWYDTEIGSSSNKCTSKASKHEADEHNAQSRSTLCPLAMLGRFPFLGVLVPHGMPNDRAQVGLLSYDELIASPKTKRFVWLKQNDDRLCTGKLAAANRVSDDLIKMRAFRISSIVSLIDKIRSLFSRCPLLFRSRIYSTGG